MEEQTLEGGPTTTAVLRHITPAGWVSLVGSVVLAAAVSVFLVVATAQPPYALVLTAEPEQVMRASDQLDRYGIAWTIRENGGQLAVPEAVLARARAVIAPRRSRVASAELDATTAKQVRLQQLLDSVVGAGKATVVVNREVNRDRTRRDRLAYARRGTAVRWGREAETLTGPGLRGRARVASADWAVGKTVTRTRLAPGVLTRETVALVVDRRVPRRTVAELRRTVATAAGIDRRRGDRLSVARVRMRAPQKVAPPGPLGPLESPQAVAALGHARWIALAIGFAVFLVAAVQALRRAESAGLVPLSDA